MSVFTARRCASAAGLYAVVVCSSVRPSARLSQAAYVSKRLDASSWFLAWRLIPFTYILHWVRKFGYLQKYGYFPLEFCPKLLKISRRQFDRVVNKTRRRRPRSSLDESWLFITSRSINCRPNPLNPLIRFPVALLESVTTCFYSWQDWLT